LGREAFENNGGFWRDAEFDEETQKFTATIEAASPEDEKIIGKKVKGLSMWTQEKYEAPNGKTYLDAPMHLALTNKPMAVHVGEDQEWEELPDDSLALCMSDMIGVDPVVDMGALKTMLKRVAKIALPEDVTPDSLVQSLVAVLAQKELSESEGVGGVDLTVPPKDSEEVSAPIIMSEEDQMTKELEEKMASLQSENEGLKKRLLDQERASLGSRIDSLIMSDVGGDYAKGLKEAVTKAEGSQFHILEAKVEALEAIPKPQKKVDNREVLMSDGTDLGGEALDNPLHVSDEMDEKRQEEVVNSMLSYVN
jgi:hypothetical protein